MSEANYNPVADGWYNSVAIAFAQVTEDHFYPETTVLKISFDLGDGNEQPRATLPIVYAHDHMIVEWEDGERKEHKATEADQREAVALLGRIFPAWAKYCAEDHEVRDKINWFELDGSAEVSATKCDIKVWHSTSGFPNARIKDPASAKPRKVVERVLKSEAITRANAAFASVFKKADNATQAPAPTANPTPDAAANKPVSEDDFPF